MFSISNTLIIISACFTFLTYIFPEVYILGMNSNFLNKGIYHIYAIQFFTSQFLHGGLLHLAMNSIFIYYFGNILESIIGKKQFLIFFVFVALFNGTMLTFFSSGNTIGISGFAMALLTYYTLELKSRKNPEYKGGITAIIINVGVGFFPGVSLVGHFFGVVAGVIFYFCSKDFFGRLLSPIKKVEES